MTNIFIGLALGAGSAVAILFIAWLVVKNKKRGEGFGPEAEADQRYITRIRSNFIEGIE